MFFPELILIYVHCIMLNFHNIWAAISKHKSGASLKRKPLLIMKISLWLCTSLKQWLSNFLVSRPVYALKNYWRAQISFKNQVILINIYWLRIMPVKVSKYLFFQEQEHQTHHMLTQITYIYNKNDNFQNKQKTMRRVALFYLFAKI